MMKNHSTTQRQSKSDPQRGQSLVEVALFFPIFIILLAGLVEVSQLLITQNRVSSAARASTRFASNGGQDEGMITVALNNVTQTLQTDQGVWDLWSIRATVNEDATGFDEWTFTHIYGISNTVQAPSIDETAIQTQVLDELRQDEFNNNATDSNGVSIAAGVRIVGTYAIHDVDSILGLDAMSQLAGFSSLEALSIMRITATGQQVTNGCAAFPIAVHEGARSVTAPGTGSNPYPNAGDFTYPSNPPVYESFTSHDDDVALRDAEEGDVFRVQNGSGNGNFGWLVWNTGISGDAGTLANSIAWPGDSTNYNECTGSNGCNPGQGIPGSGFDRNVPGYIDPNDPTDQAIHIGDDVAASTGSINSSFVQDVIEEHVMLDRELRLIVWDTYDGTGSTATYHISGFAIFRLIGYSLDQSGGGSWILAEFKRWDTSCGQLTN